MDGIPTTAIVTGVTRGLGRALTNALVEEGVVVFGCGRSRRAIHELSRAYPHPHDFTVVDVTSDVQVMNWIRRLVAEYGPPDFVINNAGLINESKALWYVSDLEFTKVLDTNVRGPANVLRYLLPPMIHRGRGVIVNFSSGWGRSASPKVAPYCATKWAIEGLTRSLAQELPAGMAAVAVNPGIINTDMLQSCFGEDAENFCDPETWAAVATPFLLGLRAKHNGQSLSIPSPDESSEIAETEAHRKERPVAGSRLHLF